MEDKVKITNLVSGDSGDSVQAALNEGLKLSYVKNNNYSFIKWEKSINGEDNWVDSTDEEQADVYHYFRPVFIPEGAECWILSKDDLNIISQPIVMKRGIIEEVNTKYIGTKDPNSLVNNKYIKDSNLGDFFFMIAQKEE